MQTRLAFRMLLVLVVLTVILLTPLAAYAQEEGTQAVEETAQEAPTAGLTILILLVGLGAVALVAGRVWLRDNYPDDSATSGEG